MARAGHRILAVVFAVSAVYLVVVFAHGLQRHRLRPTPLFVAGISGATAVGLWTCSRWGRVLGLIVTLANAGIGALTLLAAIVGKTATIGPAIYLAVNVAAAIGLSALSRGDET